MSAVRNSAGMPLPADDGWAILAQPPGVRDLGVEDYWQVSLERSLRRRNAPRRGRLIAAGGAPLSVALTAMAIGGAGTAVAATSGSGDLNLDRGATGASVRTLQQALGVTADGVFGPRTERAVKAYQANHGLPATGHVGPLTTQALGLVADAAGAVRSASGASADATSQADATGNGGAAPVALSPDQVKAMQRALGVSADGVIGPQTKAALSAYEAQHGLPADGVPDAEVLKALGASAPPGGDASTTPAAAPAAPSGVQAAVASALTKVGAPYRAGAAGPSAFDCSGLVSWAMSQAGISVPRTSFAQFGVGSAVPKGSIQAGDLVFFDTAGSGASDVGLATSATTAVSATTHGVMTHSISTGYWGAHYVGARRIA